VLDPVLVLLPQPASSRPTARMVKKPPDLAMYSTRLSWRHGWGALDTRPNPCI
jgi:hypothetical protein